jgi:hypothetical protein
LDSQNLVKLVLGCQEPPILPFALVPGMSSRQIYEASNERSNRALIKRLTPATSTVSKTQDFVRMKVTRKARIPIDKPFVFRRGLRLLLKAQQVVIEKIDILHAKSICWKKKEKYQIVEFYERKRKE